jgi:diguanylate cyclase (GGDEF)-like protein
MSSETNAAMREPDLTGADAAAAYASSMRVLLEVTRSVRGGAKVGTLLGTIARAASEALGFGTVVLNLYRQEWDDFCVAAVHGNAAVRDALEGSVYTWDAWRPLLHPTFRREGAYFVPHDSYDWSKHDGTRFVPDGAQPIAGPSGWHPEDELFVTLERSDGEIVGILSFGDPTDGLRPSDEKLQVTVSLAAHAALALETAQEREQWERYQRGLEELLRVSSQLPQTVTTEAMLTSVCTAVRDALAFDKVLIQLVEPETGMLVAAASAGWDGDERALKASFDPAVISRLFDPEFEIAGCYLVPSAEAERRVGSEHAVYSSVCNGAGPRGWDHHWLAVPLLRADSHLAGVIWVDEPRNRLIPSANVLQALRIFGNHATETLAAARQLAETRYLADHDPLTGLLNRRALLQRLVDASEQQRLRSLALVFFDLDGFKRINDEHGHSVGDRVLEQIGIALAELVRDGDLAFRLGGDEFALLLPTGGEAEARIVVERIVSTFETNIDPFLRSLAASFGVATGRFGRQPDELLRIADEAMYEAKRAGKRIEVAV